MSGIKKLLQWVLILIAGGASYFAAVRWGPAANEDEGVVEVVPRSERSVHEVLQREPSPEVVRDPFLSLPAREQAIPKAEGDAFAVLSWLPPPPPPRVVVPRAPPPPPAPVAPPLPFTFVGMMESGGPRPQAFLSKGDALLIVGAGDVLDNNTYRVDSLSPEKIVITYLPLNTAQTLNIPGASK